MMNRTLYRLMSAASALLFLVAIASCGSDAVSSTAAANDPTVEPIATTAPVPAADKNADDNDHAEADHHDDDTDGADDNDHADADHDDDDADNTDEADNNDHADVDHDGEDHEHDESGSVIDYNASYELIDKQFGTMVSVVVDGDTRTVIANSLPDHETGDFPNSGNPNTISEQSVVLELTTNPVFVGDATFALAPGIAVNGVTFEPGTAESVSCESGETYRIEGLQDMFNLGMDFNNAHVQPTGKYHYHGISELLVDNHDTDEDLALIGFAADGFLMYYSKSGAYSSSYQLAADARTGTDCTATGPAGGTQMELEGTAPDGTYNLDWDYVEGAGDLDSCNGTEIDGQYAYVITDEYPYVSRCLNGEFTGGGPGGGAGPGPGAGPGQGARPEGGQGEAPGAGQPPRGPSQGAAPGAGQGPDLAAAAQALGVSEDALRAALGEPPPDFDAAAAALGITIEQLEAVLPAPRG